MIVDLQVEIKRFLESVYGLKVEDVRTINYEGKRKRRKTGFFREIDYKKVRRRQNILTTIINYLLKALWIWELNRAAPSLACGIHPRTCLVCCTLCAGAAGIFGPSLSAAQQCYRTRVAVCAHLDIASTCRHMSH